MCAACSVNMDYLNYDRRINPGINPNAGRVRRRRKRQVGGSAYSEAPSIKDILITAAAGVLNKQTRRIQNGVKNVNKTLLNPGLINVKKVVQLNRKVRELDMLLEAKNVNLETIFL